MSEETSVQPKAVMGQGCPRSDVWPLDRGYQKLFGVILDHIPCEILAISPNYEVLMVNQELKRLTGIKRKDAVGKLCYDTFGEGQPCENCPVKRALATKTIHKNLKRQRVANRKTVYVEQMAIPVLDRDSQIDYVVEMSRDITQQVKLVQKNKKIFMETVTSLAKLIDSRDHSTGQHSARMKDIATSIGKKMGLSQSIIEEISITAILHDIGKIGIPEDILKKPGKLMPHEYHIIQRHPQIGYDTLVNISGLKKVAEYILSHHEMYNGQGYPAKKRGGEIPLISRIISVADVYEAITADRVYRKAMSQEQALQVMHEGRGNQFDPVVLDALFKVLARQGVPVKKRKSSQNLLL